MGKEAIALPLSRCLAKSGKGKAGRTVEDHCRLAAEIALELVSGFLRPIARLLPEGFAAIVFVHDVGKVEAWFQMIVRFRSGLAIPEILAWVGERDRVDHCKVSHDAIIAWAKERHPDSIRDWRHTAGNSLNHHARDAGGGRDTSKCDPEYNAERFILLDMGTAYGEPGFSDDPREAAMQRRLVLGLTFLCDWLASGRDFEDPSIKWKGRIGKFLEDAGFREPAVIRGKSFRELFGFDPGPIQDALIGKMREIVSARPGGGIHVIEAPMGAGKTEMALFAAYMLLCEGLVRGIHFALPTCLTSDLMRERVDAFLERILEGGGKAVLSHGGARASGRLDGEEFGAGKEWFDGRRKALLAPFGVGTVDQALFAVMNRRHAELRLLGLAGKAVIIDEVHSYDAYTGELVDELARTLAACGCHVFILSATLTAARKGALLGRTGGSSAYPLLSFMPEGGEFAEIAPAPGESREVALKMVEDNEAGEDAALNEAAERARAGQMVIWIENSVAKAQGIFRKLPGDIPAGLLHSRFTRRDRWENEARWAEIYGKDGKRDRGCILVGTQVLEQSLDIDADFMVSRMAPIDMLIQRLGRLWRHDRPERAESARRETWILAPSLADALANPKEAFESRVYDPWVLASSLRALDGRQGISLPGDIRGLIGKAYEAGPESGMMAAARAEMEKKAQERRDEARYELDGKVKSLDGKKPDDREGTRLIDDASVPVLILRELGADRCILADGAEISPGMDRMAAADALSMNMVRAFDRLGTPREERENFRDLLHEWRRLEIAVLDGDGNILDADGDATPFRYTREAGWERKGD